MKIICKKYIGLSKYTGSNFYKKNTWTAVKIIYVITANYRALISHTDTYISYIQYLIIRRWHILDAISGLQTARPLQKIHRQTEEHQNIAHTRSPS